MIFEKHWVRNGQRKNSHSSSELLPNLYSVLDGLTTVNFSLSRAALDEANNSGKIADEMQNSPQQAYM